MPDKYVVDTHALLWFLGKDARLGVQAKAVLSDPNVSLVVPVIVLAEACWIIEAGRASVKDPNVFLDTVRDDPRVEIVPLDEAIVRETLTLSDVGEMHDRQIVATALLSQRQGHSVALLTKDANITASGIVPVVW